MSLTSKKYDNYSLVTVSTEKLDSILSPELKAEFVLINKNGDKNIMLKGKAPDQETFMKILKGDLKCFTISIYKKGWFSDTKLGQ